MKCICASWYDVNEENESVEVCHIFRNLKEFYKFCDDNDYCDDEFILSEENYENVSGSFYYKK